MTRLPAIIAGLLFLAIHALLALGLWAIAQAIHALNQPEPEQPPQRAPQGDWAKPAWERANYASEIAKHGEPQMGGTGI